MDLFVLDQNLEAIAIVDTYNSLIWTDRYQECGDFELYRSISKELLEYIKQDYYLVNNESEHTMIIEKLLINSDPEEGNHITVTGRSLESILDRRIIWGLKTISGNLQNGIKTLLEENIISPEDPDRKIDNFVFEESTDPAITELGIDAQYTGDNLYEVIKKICVERGIGFKVTLNDQKQFVFKLYAGVDRSYEQVERPHVVFSPSFDNIVDSNYIESKSSLKNVTLVGGEGEGSERKYVTVGSESGLNRRELFTDARDISSDVGDGKVLTEAEYNAQLEQRGKEDLAENTDVVSFEGQAETSRMFVYGRDFFNGDIVQVADEYGHEIQARVLEIITSEDEQGRSVYPTFSTDNLNMLPPEYTRLEYIESSGTQYIDTMVLPNQNSRVVLDAYFLEGTETKAIFGARNDTNKVLDAFGLWNSTGTHFSTYYAASSSDVAVVPTGRHKIDKNRNVTTIDDVSVEQEKVDFQANYSLVLFSFNNSDGTDERMVSMRLYSCKIYDNGVLIRNYVPCKNKNGTLGLYDMINRRFYKNSGSGTFIPGEKGV